MERRCFLVLVAVVAAAASLPGRSLFRSSGLASVHAVRAPSEWLLGTAGGCAGARRARGVVALVRKKRRAALARSLG